MDQWLETLSGDVCKHSYINRMVQFSKLRLKPSLLSSCNIFNSFQTRDQLCVCMCACVCACVHACVCVCVRERERERERENGIMCMYTHVAAHRFSLCKYQHLNVLERSHLYTRRRRRRRREKETSLKMCNYLLELTWNCSSLIVFFHFIFLIFNLQHAKSISIITRVPQNKYCVRAKHCQYRLYL